MASAAESLEDVIRRTGNVVGWLRDSLAPPTVFPIRPEFSNWRSEQRAWRDSCALMDQSHHMTDLFIKGPDALALLMHLGVNSFATFEPGRAKQFLAVNPDGYIVGDAILFYLERESFNLVGHTATLDWVQFHGEHGDWNVTFERDPSSLFRQGDPVLFRYEVQGPTAAAVLETATGQDLPDVAFFSMTELEIAGQQVRALRHGMAGRPGFELFGPWRQGARVHEALLEAGQDHGLVQVGAKAYSVANLESGWVPALLPAIFSGDELTAYRSWLPATAVGSLAGSFLSDDIRDYYLTPHELGYRKLIAFDHEFVGREALARLGEEPHREKVTLVWNGEDVASAIGTLFDSGMPRAKYIDLPKARYGRYQADAVLLDGRLVGISHDCGHIANESAFVSLASVDTEESPIGSEVTVLWGESPNSLKPQVEPHEQLEIRATVAPCPYVAFARTEYRSA